MQTNRLVAFQYQFTTDKLMLQHCSHASHLFSVVPVREDFFSRENKYENI